MSIEEKFSQGKIVIKIRLLLGDVLRDIGMVITKDDYECKLAMHSYHPAMFLIDVRLRLAYIYGCLNWNFTSKKSDRIYLFEWREIGSDVWKEWFRVLPYVDDPWLTPNIIETK